MNWLNLVGNVFLVVAVLGALAFPILYLRSPWYESTVGRDVMTFSVATCVILGLSVAVRIAGLNGTPRLALAAAVYVALAYLYWRRVIVLWQIQDDPDRVARRDEARRARRRANRR